MTAADLLEVMKTVNILMYPYTLYCNPDDAKALKEHIPKTIKIVPLSFIDKGTSYLMDRAKFEKELYIPMYDLGCRNRNDDVISKIEANKEV